MILENVHLIAVYVLLSHRQYVPRVLVAMTVSGLLKKEKKEYFLLHVDREEFREDNWPEYIFGKYLYFPYV